MKNRILKNTISTSIVLILFFTVLMPVFSQTDWSNSQVRTPITKYSMLQMQSSRQTMIPVESYSYDVSGSSVSYSGTEPELTINWSLSQIPQPPSGYLDVGLHMTISSNLSSTTILSSAIIINCSNPLSNSTRHPYLHALDLNYLTPMVFNSSISQWEVIPDYFFYTNNYTLGFNITYTSELPFENCTYYAFFTSRIPASIKVNGGITATAYEGDGLNLTVEIYCLQYLTNLSYRWESSLDGLLSTSRNCSGVLLSSGIHNITLRISADGMTETSRTLYSIVVMLSPAFWFTAGASARHDCEVMYEMPASNSTKFFFNITNGKLRSPPVSSGADDRALIFGVCDGVDAGVYCIRQTDGELIWKKPLPVTSDPSPVGGVEIPPVVAGNKVYVITKPVFPLGLNSLVLGLNLTTGQEEINISVGQQVCSSSTIIGRYMYFTTINDVLYCVDLDNNSVRWSTPVPLSFASVPTVWHGVVFVGTVNVTDNFLAFKAETGELLWNTTLPDCVTVPPLIAVGSGPNGEDLVVVAGRNLSMRAYNAGRIASMSGGYQDSDLIWSWNGTGALDESFGYGLATDSLGIFAQTSKGRVFFLDATTGSDVGNFTSAIQGAFIGFPAFSYPSSKAAFMYQNGTVIVLNTTTRQIVWEYRTVAPSLCGPVLTS
ncbi:MAG: PQQ-binding-like beta-propeller repeat protein, partial [Thermoplasmata archaeon]